MSIRNMQDCTAKARIIYCYKYPDNIAVKSTADRFSGDFFIQFIPVKSIRLMI